MPKTINGNQVNCNDFENCNNGNSGCSNFKQKFPNSTFSNRLPNEYTQHKISCLIVEVTKRRPCLRRYFLISTSQSRFQVDGLKARQFECEIGGASGPIRLTRFLDLAKPN